MRLIPQLNGRRSLVVALLIAQTVILGAGWPVTFRIVRHQMAGQLADHILEQNVRVAEQVGQTIQQELQAEGITDTSYQSAGWHVLQNRIERLPLDAGAFACIVDEHDRILCHPDIRKDTGLRDVKLGEHRIVDARTGQTVKFGEADQSRVVAGQASFLADGVHYVATKFLPEINGRLLVHQPEAGLISTADTMTQPVVAASGFIGLSTVGITAYACLFLLRRYDSFYEQVNRKLDAEVDRIASIQRALLPAELPQVNGLDMVVSYETFDRAGGDMYAFIREGDEPHAPIGVLIADVSGHGPAAAVVMALLRGALWSLPDRAAVLQRPSLALAYLNQQLCDTPIEASFVTAFMAVYDPQQHTLTYARAGHPPPLRRTQRNNHISIDTLDGEGGVPLGVLEGEVYPDHQADIEPGQTLVLFTDGITETRAGDSRSSGGVGEMFGVQGIEAVLRQANQSAQQTTDALLTAATRHLAGAKPGDDQTVVVMRFA